MLEDMDCELMFGVAVKNWRSDFDLGLDDDTEIGEPL